MDKQERNGVWLGAPLVEEVNVERFKAVDGNLGHVVRQLVELLLLRSPVKRVLPMFGEPSDVVARRAIRPVVGEVDLVRVCSLGQFRL